MGRKTPPTWTQFFRTSGKAMNMSVYRLQDSQLSLVACQIGSTTVPRQSGMASFQPSVAKMLRNRLRIWGPSIRQRTAFCCWISTLTHGFWPGWLFLFLKQDPEVLFYYLLLTFCSPTYIMSLKAASEYFFYRSPVQCLHQGARGRGGGGMH